MADGQPPPAHGLRERLAAGLPVDDDEVDAHLPEWLRRFSFMHWTPVAVAVRAARFLAGSDGARAHVLDVGAGVGKLCVVGSLATGARFTGVERRPSLVGAARALATAFGAHDAGFVQGLAEELDWSRFTGIYLYNPFSEHVLDSGDDDVIDRDLVHSRARHRHLVRATAARLYLTAPGTRVVTYCGFGGPMPPGFERVDSGGSNLGFYVRRASCECSGDDEEPHEQEGCGGDEEPTTKMRPR